MHLWLGCDFVASNRQQRENTSKGPRPIEPQEGKGSRKYRHIDCVRALLRWRCRTTHTNHPSLFLFVNLLLFPSAACQSVDPAQRPPCYPIHGSPRDSFAGEILL